MAYDTQALKDQTDLVEIASQDTRLRRVTAGGEYAGPCPKCGGDDRFHVARGFAFCRQCWPLDVKTPAHDAIGYVMWRDTLTFAEACQALGGNVTEHSVTFRHTETEHSGAFRHTESGHSGPYRDAAGPGALPPEKGPGGKGVKRETSSKPSDPGVWQDRARALISQAQAALWDHHGGLDYLRARALSDDAIRGAGLGLILRDTFDDPGAWGFPVDGKKIAIPRGILIPCEIGGAIRYVKIRRPQGDIDKGHPKYQCIRGSDTGGVLYGLDGLQGKIGAILTEGEFDAILLQQALGDVQGLGVAGLTSASDTAPAPDALACLVGLYRLYVAGDADKAGERASKAWGALSARSRALIPTAPAKDITEMAQTGLDVAGWALRAILDDLPDGGDDATPAARLWLACYGAYMLRLCGHDGGIGRL